MNALPLPITRPLPRGSSAFVSGFSAFLVGLKLVLPGGGFFRYAIAPIVTSGVVLIGAAIAAFFAAKYWLVEWLDTSWVGWLGGFLALAVALVLAYLVFVPFMALFAPIFIDPICEKVHLRYTGKPLISDHSAKGFMKRQLFAVVQSLKWLAVALLIQLPLTVLSIVTGGIAAAIAIPLGAVIQGSDLMDYPLALRDYTLGQKLAWVKANIWAAAGMGSAASLVMFVPGLNLFAVPGGAAAATLLMLATDSGEPETVEQP